MGTIRTIWEPDTVARIKFRPSPKSGLKAWFSALRELAGLARAIIRKQDSRIALRDLSDHQLRDIGITRHQAREESSKYFWS